MYEYTRARVCVKISRVHRKMISRKEENGQVLQMNTSCPAEDTDEENNRRLDR